MDGGGGLNETCNVGDDVGLISHIEVFMRGYISHSWGGRDGGGGEGGERETCSLVIKKKQKKVTRLANNSA